MIITKQQIAVNLLNYLQHKTTINDLVEWAETAFMEMYLSEHIILNTYPLP